MLSVFEGLRTAAVANLSNVGFSHSGTFNVKWFYDGKQGGYGSHGSLAPGEMSNANVRFDWTPAVGQHTLCFAADVDNHVREGNENNNSFKIAVNVRSPAYITLDPVSLWRD